MGALSLKACAVAVALLLAVACSHASEPSRGKHICDVDCLQQATGWQPEVDLKVAEDTVKSTHPVQAFLTAIFLDLDERVVENEKILTKDGSLNHLGLTIDRKVGEGRYATAYLVHVTTRVSLRLITDSLKVGDSMIMKVPKFNNDVTRNEEIARVMANEFAVMSHLSVLEKLAAEKGRQKDYRNILKYYGYTYLEEDALADMPDSYNMIAPVKQISDETPLDKQNQRNIYNLITAAHLNQHVVTAAIYENCRYGDVQSMLDSNDFSDMARGDNHDAYYRIMDGVLNGLSFLSNPVKIGSTGDEAMVAHRDIKPANIFVCRDPTRDGGKVAKIGDFGLAQHAVKPKEFRNARAVAAFTNAYMTTVIGTEEYAPPELHALTKMRKDQDKGKEFADAYHLSWNGFSEPKDLIRRLASSKEDRASVKWMRASTHIDAIWARDIWSAGITFFLLLTNKPSRKKEDFLGLRRDAAMTIQDYILEGCGNNKVFFDPDPIGGSSSIWRDVYRQYGEESTVVKLLQGMLSCNPLDRPNPYQARYLLRKTALRKAVRQNCFSHCVDGIMHKRSETERAQVQKQLQSRLLKPRLPYVIRTALVEIEEVCLHGVIRYDKEWPTTWESKWGEFPPECRELNFVIENEMGGSSRRTSSRLGSTILDDVARRLNFDDVSADSGRPIYRSASPLSPSGQEYDLSRGEPALDAEAGDDENPVEKNRMFFLSKRSKSRKRSGNTRVRREDEHETDSGATTAVVGAGSNESDEYETDPDTSSEYEYGDDGDDGDADVDLFSPRFERERRDLMRQSSFVSSVTELDRDAEPGLRGEASYGLDQPSPLLASGSDRSFVLEPGQAPPLVRRNGARDVTDLQDG